MTVGAPPPEESRTRAAIAVPARPPGEPPRRQPHHAGSIENNAALPRHLESTRTPCCDDRLSSGGRLPDLCDSPRRKHRFGGDALRPESRHFRPACCSRVAWEEQSGPGGRPLAPPVSAGKRALRRSLARATGPLFMFIRSSTSRPGDTRPNRVPEPPPAALRRCAVHWPVASERISVLTASSRRYRAACCFYATAQPSPPCGGHTARDHPERRSPMPDIYLEHTFATVAVAAGPSRPDSISERRDAPVGPRQLQRARRSGRVRVPAQSNRPRRARRGRHGRDLEHDRVRSARRDPRGILDRRRYVREHRRRRSQGGPPGDCRFGRAVRPEQLARRRASRRRVGTDPLYRRRGGPRAALVSLSQLAPSGRPRRGRRLRAGGGARSGGVPRPAGPRLPPRDTRPRTVGALWRGLAL